METTRKFEDVEIRHVKFNKNGGLDVKFIDNSFKVHQAALKNNQDPTLTDNTVPLTISGSYEPINRVKILFRRLTHHLLLINDWPAKEINDKYIKNYEIVSDPKYKNFNVVGFTISGDSFDEENAKALLIGEHMLSCGDKVPMLTPPVRLYADSKYAYSGNLQDDLGELIDEVIKYINGEAAPSAQLNLFDQQKEEEAEEESEEETEDEEI